MSEKTKKFEEVALSEQELDNVAGGLGATLPKPPGPVIPGGPGGGGTGPTFPVPPDDMTI